MPKNLQPLLQKKVLHPDLYASGMEYVQDEKQTAQEFQQLWWRLSLLLKDSKSIQDIRDALPDTIVALFPELSALPRQRKEAWSFEDKPLQMVSYPKLAELLDFYVANRLIY